MCAVSIQTGLLCYVGIYVLASVVLSGMFLAALSHRGWVFFVVFFRFIFFFFYTVPQCFSKISIVSAGVNLLSFIFSDSDSGISLYGNWGLELVNRSRHTEGMRLWTTSHMWYMYSQQKNDVVSLSSRKHFWSWPQHLYFTVFLEQYCSRKCWDDTFEGCTYFSAQLIRGVIIEAHFLKYPLVFCST